MCIVAGLQGIVLAALLHGQMPGPQARNERRLPLRLSMSPGGIVLLVCGGVALLGFSAGRLLARALRGGPGWLTTTAYAVLAIVVAVWRGQPAWALGLAEPRREPRRPATVASRWPPPVAPA